MKDKVTYAASGVDIDRQDQALARIRPLAKGTRTPGVRSDIGLFGGLFSAAFPESRPILVSSMDGVGTKLKVARLAGIWDTVGADLVNHCINDILVQGARPLFFLDYIASSRLEPDIVEGIVSGMAAACRASGCALLGGELAEMPGVYLEGEVDVAGTIVGVVDEALLLPRPGELRAGDLLLGLPSAGLHTNGYSLARKVCFEEAGLALGDLLPGTSLTVGQALLAPHLSYLGALAPLLPDRRILAMAHITGGGLTDNLPRVLPPDLDAVLDPASWEIPPLFRFLMERSAMPLEDARRTLNLGVGMVLMVGAGEAEGVLAALGEAGEAPWILGRLAPGAGGVRFLS